MPSLKKKKSSYESTGFVRRMLKKGSSFRSLNNGSGDSVMSSSSGNQPFGRLAGNEGSKWRPRKNQFERLDGDDDESITAGLELKKSFSSSWGVEHISTFPSTESESGEYKRDIMFDKKATALINRTPSKDRDNKGSKKREFSPIKSPGKDTSVIRGPSSTKKIQSKIQEEEIKWGNNDNADVVGFGDNKTTDANQHSFFPVASSAATNSASNSFGFQINPIGGHSKQNVTKKCHTIPSREEQSSANPQSSYSSVASDPTDFFSKEQTTKLTMSNLAKMDSSLDNTHSISAGEKEPAMGGIERMVKERKFYQFTIDEDKASTVVESTFQLPADYPYGDRNYSIDDDETQFSCSETSQETRIQQRSKTNEIVSKTSEIVTDDKLNPIHSGQNADDVNEFDAFFPGTEGDEKDGQKEFDAFFPLSTKKDSFFDECSSNQQESRQKLAATESDISSSWGDAYFERSYKSSTEFEGRCRAQRGRCDERRVQKASTKSLASQQVSITSLSYSPSPVHKAKSTDIPQNGRQPLTHKNTQSGAENNNIVPSGKKVVQGNDWFRSENSQRKSSEFQFDDFVARPPSFKKRNSSIASSNIQLPPSDPFESLPNGASAKENFAVRSNRPEDFGGDWRAYQKNQYPIHRRKSFEEEDKDDDDNDSFDDVGPWEKQSSFGNGISRAQLRNSGNRSRLSRHNYSPANRPSRNQYIDDGYVDDDNRSTGGFSFEKPSRSSAGAGSYAKPLALPSNAIVASMLFRTHYDIDQNDVEEKINKFEEENSKQREIRHLHGDIPDDVHADTENMTTVSSFSDATSAYFQESWRRPSRDLVNHLSSARALDMDYPSARRFPTRQVTQAEQQLPPGLYEA
ncbi:unnamed protein product [Pseudo-nitzschia multistriata]|uniref:Uncharacterized protein n=1 Tax=Pseudo-nitzschia multistriata TaxID=183589 RepID=A0A448YXL5_9STRA|nr:unnamed protein product [Pseudo-nitzschia multistriata]